MRRALVLLTLLAAACSGGGHTGSSHSASPAPSATATSGTAADVAFASQMVPHHEQALVMADAVLERGANPDVKALAQRIKAAQAPEITRLKSILTALGGEPASGHGGHSDGMMSEDEIAALESASGEELDALFLELMVKHHEGAVVMADAELADGTYADARSLATEIKAAQTKEIAEMKGLLSQLNG